MITAKPKRLSGGSGRLWQHDSPLFRGYAESLTVERWRRGGILARKIEKVLGRREVWQYQAKCNHCKNPERTHGFSPLERQ
jgi:hypothetical protein